MKAIWLLKRVLSALPMLLAAVVLNPATAVKGAVGLTVSPSVITNDFVGKISLTISGLTPGASARVDKVADFNTNGIVDGTDLVVRSLVVADGYQPILCGLTNLNVPGDVDASTNGQIKTELFFPSVHKTLDLAPGQFIYRVSDATTGVQLAAQVFTVIATTRGQGVRGRITAGGTPLTNGLVALIRQRTESGGAGFTDADGNYALYAAPGNYMVAAVSLLRSNYVSDLTAGAVTVVANQFVTNNLSLVSASLSVSGRISDLAPPNKGIQVGVLGTSTNKLVSFGLADTNGNYTLPVTGGQWKIKPAEDHFPLYGYQSPKGTNIITATGSVANVNFQVPKGNALIYGTLKDQTGRPVIGLDCSAQLVTDQGDSLLEAVGRSYPPNGVYTLAVTSGTNWGVGVFNDVLWLYGYANRSTSNINLTGCSAPVDLAITNMNLSGVTRPAPGLLQFLLNGVRNYNYTIQTNGNLLNSSNWGTLLITNAPTDAFVILDTRATNSLRFYRALAGP